MAKVKDSLFGGKQSRPLPGLGGSHAGSSCLKGGKASQRDLFTGMAIFSEFSINTYLPQLPGETSLRSPQLQACLLTADRGKDREQKTLL